MGKKKNTNSQRAVRAADAAVILICLLGAFLSFWFFWRDLNRTINRNQAPVGSITFKKGGAQRRLGDRVLWDRLRRESPVYDGDFIRTAELSDATVTFTGGQKFSLSESSLIQIRTMEGRAVIDLALGNISVENTGPEVLVLISGDKRVELSGIMRARVPEGGGFELEVLEGTALIHSGDEAIRREAGQVLAIDEDGGLREQPRVVMLLPRPGEELVSPGETLGVNFSWMTVNFTGEELTRLEIAGDRRFTRPLTGLDLESSSVSVDLPPGTYWWRAYASGGPGAAGPESASPEKLIIRAAEPAVPVLSLSVPATPEAEGAAAAVPAAKPAVPAAERTPAPPPVPPAVKSAAPEGLLPAAADRRPEDGYVIGPDQLRQNRRLVFRWSAVAGANGYILTLLDDSGKTLLNAGPQAETSYTLDLRNIDRGGFVWRLEAVRRKGDLIERRGIAAANRFTLDIPLPGNPQVRDPGILYGLEP